MAIHTVLIGTSTSYPEVMIIMATVRELRLCLGLSMMGLGNGSGVVFGLRFCLGLGFRSCQMFCKMAINETSIIFQSYVVYAP